MLDFHRKKEANILHIITQRDNIIVSSDQTKTLYDYVLKHDSQIKEIQLEMYNFKSQLIEMAMKSSFTQNSINNSINLTSCSENNNLLLSQIKKFKNEIKNELLSGINDIINSNIKKELKEQIFSLKEGFNPFNDERNNEKKFQEINKCIENINQKLILNIEEKNNLQNIIFNKVNNDKIEINNIIQNLNKRIDNFDLDFDRLIQNLKSQFQNSSDTINQLNISKVNINDFEKQIEIINKSILDLNIKLDNNIKNQNSDIINRSMNRSFNKNIEDDVRIKKDLIMFKTELNNDLEKINLKMLNELKNQADDIKNLYQDMNKLQNKVNNNLYPNSQINSEFAFTTPNKKLVNLLEKSKKNLNIPDNIMEYLDSELSKKANLEQLNFALETQAKLNEAFSSASKISRFCWDSDGVLKDDKYIKWSIQNINTGLDVFKWEKNSENITILQNGVYKIVFGLIGLETDKYFGINFNDDENIIVDFNKDGNTNLKENESDINIDKENIKFMEKYIACIENTNIKAIVFNNSQNNDNSEEAFLEITKII